MIRIEDLGYFGVVLDWGYFGGLLIVLVMEVLLILGVLGSCYCFGGVVKWMLDC